MKTYGHHSNICSGKKLEGSNESPLATVNREFAEETGYFPDSETGALFDASDYAYTTTHNRGSYTFHMFIKVLGPDEEDLFHKICSARSAVVPFAQRRHYVEEVFATLRVPLFWERGGKHACGLHRQMLDTDLETMWGLPEVRIYAHIRG